MDVSARTAANRRLLAGFFDGLDEEQLRTRSLCDAGTVREVLGHLVSSMTGSLGGLLREVLRARVSRNRADEALATPVSGRGTALDDLTGVGVEVLRGRLQGRR